MNVTNSNQTYLKKKKKYLDNTPEEIKDDSSSGKQKINNKNRQNFQQKKGKIENKMQQNYNKKRLICNYYINGACHKGNECTFSHDTPQIKKPNVKF